MNMDSHRLWITGMAVIVVWLIILAVACGSHRADVVKAQYYQPAPRQSMLPDAQNHLNDGVSMFRAGRHESAADHLRKCLAVDSTVWSAHYYLGLVLLAQEQPEAATVELRSGLTLAPPDSRTRSRIYVALGQVEENLGHASQAKLNFLTALNLWPESGPARAGLERLSRPVSSAGK